MADSTEEPASYKREVLWQNVLFSIYLHMSAVYGLTILFNDCSRITAIYTFTLIIISMLSVTLGCHRLWAHRAYDATLLLRVFFAFGQTLICQGSIYDWVVDHRLHHKYHGTELDPYNYKRGFVHAQFGCRVITKHPGYDRARRDIDMSDIEQDSVVMYQHRLYWILMPLFGIIMAINAPVQYWGESLQSAIFVAGFLRIAISLHCAWLINSAVIVWGLDPLDRRSADTNLVFLVNKSLWPRYHYLLPWDYQCAEYGDYGDGICNAFLRVLAALGHIYNLRTIDADGVRNALAESSKTGKPLLNCLKDAGIRPDFSEMLQLQNKSRKPK